MKLYTQKDDLAILKALYVGNHLEQDELERALKLVYLLNRAINERWGK